MSQWDQIFVRALVRPPQYRSLQDIQNIYYGLCGLEALQTLRDSTLRTLCKVVRYEKHAADDVLYYTGEFSTCWYILLSGSVFIDGSMYLPRSRSLENSASQNFHYGQETADGQIELESQFILRLPIEPAKILREAIQSNSTLKDRLNIKIDDDMRHGEVRVDHWLLPSKVVDLPTVVESLKTIDNKSFYKTADICQMLLCKEEDDMTPDEETPQKTKKKDSNKVEKKYLWPHGITPPAKNVRKRRFRKTLKKKYVEAPEIEKEVKRLLRIDNDAVSVKWEVINEDDDKVNRGTVIKKEPIEAPNQNVAEHDIFGGEVSDSEEEDAHLNVLEELDENSQNSGEDSQLTASNSMLNNSSDSKILTEFTSDMFRQIEDNSPLIQELDYYQQSTSNISYSGQNLSREGIEARMDELDVELADLKGRRQQQEMEIEHIENQALRQRFQDILDSLLQEQIEKEQEQYELHELLMKTRGGSIFGKRTGGNARRQHECFVLEPSEMIVIDYPDIERTQKVFIPPPLPPPPVMDHLQHRTVNIMFEDAVYGTNATRSNLYYKCSRGSHSSDTSSAYSGSDTMASNHSELDNADDLDLTGLTETNVDSDEEDDLAESIDSLTVRDRVRDCLEKDASERTEEDIEILLEFTQHLTAFTNMTLAVRRELCAVMVFAVVEKAGTLVINDGEELDSWSVLINGCVEVIQNGGDLKVLNMGDSFGILPTMDKLYHRGIMRTRTDDCQFVCITQSDYYRILHQGEENIRRQEEDGKVVMVTELRGSVEPNCNRRGHVVIRGTPERLMHQLIEENSLTDPTYVEDFLLTHRTFIPSSLHVADRLLQWFEEVEVRDRVTRVVLLWVNNHFTDFETDPDMIEFLETFERGLETEKMVGQLRLLNIACAAKARIRNVVLARPSRDEPLNFQILGGYERNFGIFIFKVDKKSRAEDVGLKRGDQILEVNGQSFEHVKHERALEILKGTTHLSITVKSNLLHFKEMLNTPDNSPRPKGKKVNEISKLQTDPRARLSSVDGTLADSLSSQPVTINSPLKDGKKQNNFMTLAPKKQLQKVLMRMNILPKNIINAGIGNDQVDSFNSPLNQGSNLYESRSNPDLVSICYDGSRGMDYPEHVLKVYKPDQSYKYILIFKETTAHEVVMLALQAFGITDPSSNFSLCEVSVTDLETQAIKQRRLPDQLQNLAERIGLSSRYYLKTNGVTETLVPDELAPELLRENAFDFLQLNAVEVAIQLTLQDFSIFRQIEPTEYIDDLFELKSKYGRPMLEKFAALVNKEMFWVVTEVCSETNPVRRMKIMKQFIKVARHCKECKNFNSMFAIISGLGHGAVSRLKQCWEKLPNKYQRVFHELQLLMDPSRNMSKYRQMVCTEQTHPPIIPFYPVVKKDLTFIHLGNDSLMENLVNFEKLRMIAKEVRSLSNMCSSPYDLLTMLELGGQPASNAMITLNTELTTANSQHCQQGQTTVKRRKKSSAAPNHKKMFEESQMVRRVKAYLNNLKVITDEDKLRDMSYECEGMASGTSSNQGSQRPKRHASPAPSTTSSTSSASDERKPSAKFGTASPQTVRKLLSLSDVNKKRPYQPAQALAGINPTQASPAVRRAPSATGSYSSYGSHSSTSSSGVGGRAMHERSHSDTPTPLPSVALSAESSSVTSLSNMPLRKNATSGSVTSSDSGHSTTSHSSAGEGLLHPYQRCPSPPRPPLGPGGRRQAPPAYSVAAQMARLQRLARAHSHEGVTQSYHYHTDPDTDQGDEDDIFYFDNDTVIIMV